MLFVYSKFKSKKWNKCSYEKRFKIFQAVEKKIAKKLKIEPVKLEVNYDNDWNCFGTFTSDGQNSKIIINAILMENPKYRFHGLETISHETRHAYQYSVCSRDLKWYEFTAKSWRRNFAGYFTAGANNLMYNNQSVERDAQKYSIKFLKKHSYPDDEDYNRTLRVVVDRYESSLEAAKKEYGLFYKYKIEKNVKKQSKHR